MDIFGVGDERKRSLRVCDKEILWKRVGGKCEGCGKKIGPEIFPNAQLMVKGPQALARLGFRSTQSQFFDVLDVEHDFSSRRSAPMDTTTLYMALAAE